MLSQCGAFNSRHMENNWRRTCRPRHGIRVSLEDNVRCLDQTVRVRCHVRSEGLQGGVYGGGGEMDSANKYITFGQSNGRRGYKIQYHSSPIRFVPEAPFEQLILASCASRASFPNGKEPITPCCDMLLGCMLLEARELVSNDRLC